jgi:hypothetical protein
MQKLDFCHALLQAKRIPVARRACADPLGRDDGRGLVAARCSIIAPQGHSVVIADVSVAVADCNHWPLANGAQVGNHAARHAPARTGIDYDQTCIGIHGECLALPMEQPNPVSD